MKILAMETSTALGGVAVVIDGKVTAEESSMRQKSHSENLTPFVETCLTKSKISLDKVDAFAVGLGPGSFTGIRIAANAGKTFSYSFAKPLIAIDSLTLLAEQARGHHPRILSIINAYKNMVYLGLFEMTGDEPQYLIGPEAIPVRDLSKHIKEEALVVGDGWDAYHQYFPEELLKLCRREASVPDYPEAKTLALLAEKRAQKGQTLDWNSFVPLYIRASEAEETKKGILITPLK